MYSANLELNLGEKAKDYLKIMDKKISYKRSSVSVKRKGNLLFVKISADDPVALIASLNSVLKQVRIIGNAQRLLE